MFVRSAPLIARALAALTVFAGLSLVSPSPASATSISAYEVIYDTTCTAPGSSGGCEGHNTSASNRNLVRTRQVGAGSPVTETSDATIVLENGIDNYFGFYEDHDVSYSHILSWISPFPSGFQSATLTLKSYGASGTNDTVVADLQSLGNLVDGGNTLTQSVFGGILTANLLDGILGVTIGNSTGDMLNVFYSRLDVTYDDGASNPVPNPEPASLTLLGTGVAGLIARMRSKRQSV